LSSDYEISLAIGGLFMYSFSLVGSAAAYSLCFCVGDDPILADSVATRSFRASRYEFYE
jgi:hypothetical protein